MAIRPNSFRFGYFCGHYTSAILVFESISYQEWISTYLLYVNVGEIGGVPLIGRRRDQRNICFLLKQES